MGKLYDKLSEYSNMDNVPFHMPGHKRNTKLFCNTNAFSIDITEIDDFDNYHHPDGIIKECMEYAANVYGSKESIYLVNGSTIGIISAIYGTTNKGDKILVARNCHKAVYNAVFHQELDPVYVFPQYDQEKGMYCGIDPEMIGKMLINDPQIGVVIITSPTYEGVVSDIKKISKIVHENNAVLIVDEAHGAHFPFMEDFPETAIKEGADIIIQSLHKTLPSYTQTAIMHINSELIDIEKVKMYLGIYQTSSPSYVFMAEMDNCIRFMADPKNINLKKAYYENLLKLREKISSLNHLGLLSKNDIYGYDYDISKLVIFSKDNSITGKEIYDILRLKYHLQFEMASEAYVIGMTSICDNFEWYDRLYMALSEIDNNISEKGIEENFSISVNPEKVFTPYETFKKEWNKLLFKDAAGRISYEYVYLYPPGIPLVVPGEIISEKIVLDILRYMDKGLNVQGIDSDGFIRVVK